MTSGPICPHCGQSHRTTARFCPATGKPIAEAAASPAAVPAVPPVFPPPAQPQPLPYSPPVSQPTPGRAGMTGLLPRNALLKGRYMIIEKIGQGGMAAVYKAVDLQYSGTLWAVKEMSDSALPDPQERRYAVQAFEQEAHLLQTLTHPNLPRVIDSFTENEKHYLVMEFVPGQTLDTILAGCGQPLPEAGVAAWAIQLCDVLYYLHSQNPPIIFRDLKPSNIMITPQGQVKLIDFGIVRFFKPGKTKDTQALGTPGYTSPEAAGGQTDARSDIYSLCVTLHELLTLHDPAGSIFTLPLARGLNPFITPAMEMILARGAQPQRDLRYASMLELRADLLRLPQNAPPASARGWSAPTIAASEGSPPSGPVFNSYQPQLASPPYLPPAANPYAPNVYAAPNPSGLGPVPRVSRPTTRLILAAAQLSAGQLLVIVGSLLLLLIGGTWLLAPALAKTGINWNYVPIMSIFGAFGFAALPKKGVAFLSHSLLTFALVSTIWIRLSERFYNFQSLLAAVIISGIVLEVWLLFINRVKGPGTQQETWRREAAWLALAEVITTVLFFGIVTRWQFGLNPIQGIGAGLLGLLGWFLGDLVQQYASLRKTGMRRN